ncbi:MAG TPA: stage III sporulation protein J [Clostridiales bacterium]|nr:stage III sporulation protein J [Clostridiales bacterium]
MNYSILLTQNSTPIFKYIVWILGKMMEGIFFVLDKIGIPNVGLSIILFTIIVNIFMLPLTYKQQKFSKLSQKMNPEIKALQKKYEGKKDQNSQMQMNAEMQGIYAKYGVSPTGSCAYLLIQMPILFALYRVIYLIPAYVTKIGDTFRVLADKIISTDKAAFLKDSGIDTIANTVATYGRNMTDDNLSNGIIDVLNRVSSADMATISQHYGLADLTFNGERILSVLDANGDIVTRGLIDTYNHFLGLNIGNSPWYTIKDAFSSGKYLIVLVAVMIPLLSGATQWLSVKLMPNAADTTGGGQADSMAQSMKTMNMMMPLMSIWFCFTLPAGMGIYWIANAVVRMITQVFMNKRIDSIDYEELIRQNSGKSAKKMEKIKAQQEKMNAYASMNTKNLQGTGRSTLAGKAGYVNTSSSDSASGSGSSDTKGSSGSKSASGGSMFAKANMVSDFNNRKNK